MYATDTEIIRDGRHTIIAEAFFDEARTRPILKYEANFVATVVATSATIHDGFALDNRTENATITALMRVGVPTDKCVERPQSLSTEFLYQWQRQSLRLDLFVAHYSGSSAASRSRCPVHRRLAQVVTPPSLANTAVHLDEGDAVRQPGVDRCRRGAQL